MQHTYGSQKFKTLQITPIWNKINATWITDLCFNRSLFVGHYYVAIKKENTSSVFSWSLSCLVLSCLLSCRTWSQCMSGRFFAPHARVNMALESKSTSHFPNFDATIHLRRPWTSAFFRLASGAVGFSPSSGLWQRREIETGCPLLAAKMASRDQCFASRSVAKMLSHDQNFSTAD